jgi:hypothetical protein
MQFLRAAGIAAGGRPCPSATIMQFLRAAGSTVLAPLNRNCMIDGGLGGRSPAETAAPTESA